MIMGRDVLILIANLTGVLVFNKKRRINPLL